MAIRAVGRCDCGRRIEYRSRSCEPCYRAAQRQRHAKSAQLARIAAHGVHLHKTMVGGQWVWHAIATETAKTRRICADGDRCIRYGVFLA